MPLYYYKALSDTGTQVSGSVVARSPELLARDLQKQGLLVREIRATRTFPRIGFSRGRVKGEDFLAMNQELSTLLKAGLTVPDALDQVRDRPGQDVLADTLARVLDDVRHGTQLSQACSRYPEVFDSLYVWALKTAEQTGDLIAAIDHYLIHASRRLELRKKFSQAMTYPAFLLVTLVVVLGVLFVFVLPRFVSLYAGLGAKLPLPTRVVIHAVELLPVLAPALAIVAAAAWLVYRRWTATAEGRLRADRIKERIPGLGPARRMLATVHATRTLGAFLAGGTPLVAAMRATSEALSDRACAERMHRAAELVSEGSSLAAASAQAELLPPKANKLIAVGEASGTLDVAMENVADFYEGILDRRMNRMVTLIEPALMLFIGVFIGGIILVMYLPVFGMAEIIR